MRSRSDIEQLLESTAQVSYPDRRLPIRAMSADLPHGKPLRQNVHWHTEIEVCHLLEGSLRYIVNRQEIDLCAGDCLVVNTLRKHRALSAEGGCRFNLVQFEADVISGNERILSTCVNPLLATGKMDCMLFEHDRARCDEISAAVDGVVRAQKRRGAAFQLEETMFVQQMWLQVYRRFDELGASQPRGAQRVGIVSSEDSISLRGMLTFIYSHYRDKVTLDQIAAAGGVKHSKACQIFNDFIGLPPVSFLNVYRISVARNLLRETDLRIAVVASACGFSSQSYFARMFSKAVGCTPQRYRAGGVNLD